MERTDNSGCTEGFNLSGDHETVRICVLIEDPDKWHIIHEFAKKIAKDYNKRVQYLICSKHDRSKHHLTTY